MPQLLVWIQASEATTKHPLHKEQSLTQRAARVLVNLDVKWNRKDVQNWSDLPHSSINPQPKKKVTKRTNGEKERDSCSHQRQQHEPLSSCASHSTPQAGGRWAAGAGQEETPNYQKYCINKKKTLWRPDLFKHAASKAYICSDSCIFEHVVLLRGKPCTWNAVWNTLCEQELPL